MMDVLPNSRGLAHGFILEGTLLLLFALNFHMGACLIGTIGALVMGREPMMVPELASNNASRLRNHSPMV
jgi:hypothetical protein